MKQIRSFIPTLVFASLFISRISSPIYANDIPRLDVTQTSFSQDEDITVRYSGVPTFLQAQILDSRENNIEYKAVLKEDRDGQYLDFQTNQKLTPGNYFLKIWKDNDKLVDTIVTWGKESQEPIPTPNPSGKQFINRIAPSKLTAGKIETVKLEFIADKDIRGQLIDRVPYDAIIEATDAAQVKNPELLNLRMPFDNDYEMSAPFGAVNPAEHLGLSEHDGVDFATPVGTPVFAVDDGEIVPYHEINHYGITQAVQHSWGTTFYGHLSTTSAQIGQLVKKGQKIGISGNTGLSTGPHLHFGMKWNDDFVNSLPYVTKKKNKSFDEKEIVWPIEAKKGEKVSKTYTIVMPQDKAYVEDVSVGPAATVDDNEKPVIDEEKDWTLKLLNSPEATPDAIMKS